MKTRQAQQVNIGGSIPSALKGDYEFKASHIIREALNLTKKQFIQFLPANLFFLFLIGFIFSIALKMQVGDLNAAISSIDPNNIETITPILQAIFIASMSYEVITSPIYAGLSLMGMSHSIGLATKTSYLFRGLNFTISVMILTIFTLSLKGLLGAYIPFISIYLTMAFSQSILLVCEKKIKPLQALGLSFKAVNKKFLPMLGIYLFILITLACSIVLYGLPFIFTLPLFFHLKGIMYREMFGVQVQVIKTNTSNLDQDGRPEEKPAKIEEQTKMEEKTRLEEPYPPAKSNESGSDKGTFDA